jgi:hypothetical protein
MKYLFLLGSLLAGPLSAGVTEITVGKVALSIPAPEGYAAVSDQMQPYAGFERRFVPETNEQFASFLPADQVAVAARGEMPATGRKFYVQTEKVIVQATITSADFAQLKQVIKTQNESLMKKAEAQMPGFMDKLNKGIVDDHQLNLNLALTFMLPLPPHHETERSLAYVMFVKFNMQDAQGKTVSHEGVVTATFVHVRGKILFLYSTAEKSALAWSKDQARKWSDAVIAANPSTGAIATAESAVPRSGFDWGKVAEKGAIGAGIGAVLGLIVHFLRKRKAS